MWRQAQQNTCWFIRYFFKSKRSSYHQGRKQEYLISCNLPILSFVLPLHGKDEDKESNMSEPLLKLLVRNRLLGTLSLIAHPALLSKYPLSQHFMLLDKIPHLLGKQKRRVKMMHRSMWRQAQQIHVMIIRYFFKSKSISYHRGRKQRYLISCFFPILSFALALACRIRRKEAISQNLKLNVRSGTDCPEPLPGYLPSVALEYSSSTVNGS
ncbi:hypothetical protein ACFX15_037489 [Malus domestica]